MAFSCGITSLSTTAIPKDPADVDIELAVVATIAAAVATASHPPEGFSEGELDLVDPKCQDEKLPRPIPTADLKKLDRALASAEQPYRLIFAILRETGMRADEVLSLNVGDMGIERRREGLLLQEAKNNRERTVVLIRT